jgi:arginase family enzyme
MALSVFRARAGDRNDRAMAGAQVLGAALGDATGLAMVEIGAPAPPLGGTWRVELEAARAGLAELQQVLATVFGAGKRPLTTMGRCAAAIGALPAVARARPDAAIVWFDAHGDCNTPEHTETGYLGGMVLTGAAGGWETGLGGDLDLASVVLVGCRDLDPAERALIGQGGIRLVEPGPDLPLRLRTVLAGRPAYVHIDCDVLNLGLVPTEYQSPGGLSLEDLREACKAIAEGEVVGLEIAEFEVSWADGSPGNPGPLVAAIEPLLTAMMLPS